MKRTTKPKGRTKPPRIIRNKPPVPRTKPEKTPPKRGPGRPKKYRDINLDEREQLFADLILENLHKSSNNKMRKYECYMKAFPGVKKESAAVLASRLLSRKDVKKYIQERKQAAARRVEVNIEMVLRGLLRIALFDPRKLYTDKGRMKRVVDLDDDTALALAGLEFTNMKIGKGKKQKIRQMLARVKTESRKGAWELIGSHLNMFDGDNVDQNPQDFVNDVRQFADEISVGVPGGQV